MFLSDPKQRRRKPYLTRAWWVGYKRVLEQVTAEVVARGASQTAELPPLAERDHHGQPIGVFVGELRLAGFEHREAVALAYRIAQRMAEEGLVPGQL